MSTQGFYYIAGVRKDLAEQMRAKLNSMNMAELGNPDNDLNQDAWALIHQSRAGDVAREIKTCRLVIYFSEGAQGCIDIPKEQNAFRAWYTGTGTVIARFSALYQYVSTGLSSLDGLAPDGWLMPQPTILPALAILCQGYLAAKAIPSEKPEEQYNLNSPVNEALKKMGWHETAGSSLLKPALRGEDEAALNKLRDEVMSADYWAALGPQKDLEDGCAREWLPKGTAKDWADLKKSEKFELISGLNKGTFPIDDPEIVANAYLALCDKLGGEK